MTILVIAEHDNSTLKGATLNAVAAAALMGTDFQILVAGSNCKGVAEQAASVDGVSKVLVADNAAYKHQLAENLSKLVAEIGKNYSHIVAPATTTGKNFMPRVAALLDVAQISDITGVESEDTFLRPIYAGNAIATVQSLDEIKVITVRSTGFDAANSNGGSAVIEEIDTTYDEGISTFVDDEVADSDRPDLTAARVVISGGRGMGNGENFALLEKESLCMKIGVPRLEPRQEFRAQMTRIHQRNFSGLKIVQHFGEEPKMIHRTGHRGRAAKSGTQCGHSHFPGSKRIGSTESGLHFDDFFPVLEELHGLTIEFCANGGPLVGNHLAAATVGLFSAALPQQHQFTAGHR